MSTFYRNILVVKTNSTPKYLLNAKELCLLPKLWGSRESEKSKNLEM
ncbi:hypothetical protein [Fulvivirga sp. M361]|nr:hypothetical protein [Fulvivirga sp. M361]